MLYNIYETKVDGIYYLFPEYLQPFREYLQFTFYRHIQF